MPKERTLEELVDSKNIKTLVPPLPREVAVSFYLQSWKLIFAVYHMVTDKGVSRYSAVIFIIRFKSSSTQVRPLPGRVCGALGQ